MADTLEIYDTIFTDVLGIKAMDSSGNILTYVRPVGTLNVATNGTVDCTAYASVAVAIPSATGVSF